MEFSKWQYTSGREDSSGRTFDAGETKGLCPGGEHDVGSGASMHRETRWRLPRSTAHDGIRFAVRYYSIAQGVVLM